MKKWWTPRRIEALELALMMLILILALGLLKIRL